MCQCVQVGGINVDIQCWMTEPASGLLSAAYETQRHTAQWVACEIFNFKISSADVTRKYTKLRWVTSNDRCMNAKSLMVYFKSFYRSHEIASRGRLK